ncbi:MAG TPA: PAS domain-containing protein [Chthoniobacteraceae bacterium]|jgi:PAS domain S-box-containing protein|nr:PAS domain-containing protein [Chthoniobacteraceae bacterium]
MSLPEIDIPAEIFDDFPAMVWIQDARRRLIYVNRASAEFAGMLPEEGNEAYHERIHPDDRQRILDSTREAFEGQLPFTTEFRFRRYDGIYRSLSDYGSPLRDKDGRFVGYVGIACDVTDLSGSEQARRTAEAESARTRLLRIMESTTDLVVMALPDGQVTYLNWAARRFFALPQDQPLEGFNLSIAYPGWAHQIVEQEGIPTAIRDGMWAGETAVVNRDGRELPVSQMILAHRDADGRLEFLSTTMRDISDRKREEITRMEWANRYDAAIRASGQLLFDWNSFTNDITYAGGVEAFLGYSEHEMSGGLDRFRELIHPDDLNAFDLEIQRVTATRDPFRLDFRIERADRGVIDIAAKGFFFLDREGRIGRMVGFLADVTAQKAAQDALALAHENLEARVEQRTAELANANNVIRDHANQQQAVAQLGQRALAGAELSAILQEASDRVQKVLAVDFCSILQLSNTGEELLTTAHTGWEPGAIPDRLPASLGSQSGYTLLVREPVIVEDMALETRFNVPPSLRKVAVTSSVSVVIEANNQPLGVLAAFSVEKRSFQIDEVHFLQAVANVLTATIERQRAEESIRQAHEQAETANRAKSEFLSRMSHELRTPLNAILGFTQLLEIDDASPSQAESVSHITRAGQHLLSLINEVLDIARIEAGRLAMLPEAIPVAPFLHDVVELIRPLAARHQISAVLDRSNTNDRWVLADSQRLKQVFLNLLSNAIKYNRPGGRVILTCGPGATGRLRISVSDTGWGIQKEKMSRLFLPFERLGAEATDIEGTGIGLALSRGIVTALGGELGVVSVEGEGSTFWVDLPATVAPARPPELPMEPPAPTVAKKEPVAPAVHKKLLYIEDQDLNLRLVERILQSRPEYRLLTAMQGGIGLDLAREHQPDLILLDLNLPDMTGDEVLRRLKDDPTVEKIPVIMVSADAMGERIEQMLALGATGYLTKPYKVTEFLRVISETLDA